MMFLSISSDCILLWSASFCFLGWVSLRNPSVSGMTVFGWDYWLDYGCLVFLGVSLCSLVPCGNHAQLRGGNDAEILMSTLAYGWVERCSNIASCKEDSSQDKYSCDLWINLCNCICFNELWWTWLMCWRKCIFFHCWLHYASIIVLCSIHFYFIMFMGLTLPG